MGGALRLVDLPGYGYAVASKEKIQSWNELIRNYLRTRQSLKRVCALIDARHGIKAVDQDTMEMLDDTGVSYVVVLTKTDKVKPHELEALKSRIEEELKGFKAAYPKVYETSASSQEGISRLRAVLARGVC